MPMGMKYTTKTPRGNRVTRKSFMKKTTTAKQTTKSNSKRKK
jgi:hypothetical protein